MIINEKKPEPIPRIVETEEEQKARLLAEISKQPVGIIALSTVFANNFADLGLDVTKAWITTEQQTNALEAAYKKGVDDTISRLRSEGRLK